MTLATSTAHNGVRPRRLPQRTCVGCGSVRNKRDMVRVVRTAEDKVEADPTGKKPGRGAYLCPQKECWEAGLKKGRLERALKAKISAAAVAALRAYAERLGVAAGPEVTG